MPLEYIYVGDDGTVVVTSAKDRIAAQFQIEKELGRMVRSSEISILGRGN